MNFYIKSRVFQLMLVHPNDSANNMHSSLLILAVLFLGANALSKEQYETIMKKIQAVGASCVDKEGATADDLAELVAHKIPPSRHEAKCILACFYEHYHMMKEDRTFDKQAVIDAFAELKEMDADLHGKVMKLVDTCYEQRQIVDDRCETASLMATCSKKEAEAMGITEEAFLVSEAR